MEHRTKEEQVANFLREGIISGRFPQGSRLKQQELAEHLQISITPVREALKLLEAEGYLIGGSFRGAVVAPFDPGASVEILQLRIMLECRLVESAARKIAAPHIEALQKLTWEFEQAAKAGDGIAARAANYRLHLRLYEIAELPQTLHFIQVLWARYPFDIINRSDGRMLRAAAEHSELLRHMIHGDTANVMLTMRHHIEQGWMEIGQTKTALNGATPLPKAIGF